MTGQPDIAAVLAWAGVVARDAQYLAAALRGEPVPALSVTAAPVPAGFIARHPGSRDHRTLAEQQAGGGSKHGRYDAASAAAAGLCLAHSEPQYVQDPSSWYTCNLPAGHTGEHSSQDQDGNVRLGWPQDAGSAAGVAGGAEPDGTCTITRPDNGIYRCILLAGHVVLHEDITGHRWPTAAASPLVLPVCPAQWGEPPETMLCSLLSGHDGNHATAERIEWAGAWQTAEPKGDKSAAEGVKRADGTSVNPTTPGRDCAVPDGRELWFCHECREFHAPASHLAPAAGYGLRPIEKTGEAQ